MDNKYFKVNAQQLLYSYYIKYDVLYKLVDQSLKHYNGNNLVVYIDLYDMFKKLYEVDYYQDKTLTLVSAAINLVAHIRHFFRNKYMTKTTIYLVYGDCSTMNHKQFYSSFGNSNIEKKFKYKDTTEMIEGQLKLIQILCAYIYDVYYVRRSTDFSMFVYEMLSKDKSKTPSILLTKSQYAYQIPAICENAIIFRPKKFSGEDQSFYVDHSNVVYKLFSRVKREKTISQLKTFNPRLLSLLITMTKLQDKELFSLFNITKASNLLYDLISNYKISNDYNSDIEYVYKQINGIDKFISIDDFVNRFKAVDLIYQYRLYINSIESKDSTWFVNLYDKTTMQEINDHYFQNDPIMLDML